MLLKDKVALVTGASRGIGKAITLELAKQGAIVVGTATSEAGATAIQSYLDEAGYKGAGRVLNVNEQASIEKLMQAMEEQHGMPSILVNNAGITRDNLLLRMDDEEWDDVIDTNLTSVFRLSKICLRAMFRARYGRIINITSVVGATGNSGQVNYSAAKAGIIGFTKSLAQEIASRNITVNAVAPGFIDTDMTQSLPDLVKEELLKRIPMKRLGQPEDIAACVAFLASDSAGYLTGQTLHINGGMYMG